MINLYGKSEMEHTGDPGAEDQGLLKGTSLSVSTISVFNCLSQSKRLVVQPGTYSFSFGNIDFNFKHCSLPDGLVSLGFET